MSDDTKTRSSQSRNDAQNSRNDQIPAIRSFQFDSDAIGDIENSVNLFRGDVNIPLNLVTLPGRGDLDVSVQALYQSNVQDEVQRWNLDAPTGILGLGWSLGFARIEVNTGGTRALDAHSYFLTQGGSRMPLLRSLQVWTLFDLPASTTSTLDSGNVDVALAGAFAERGVALTTGSAVEQDEDGWRILDATLERTFRVRNPGGGADLPVEDGGLAFEAQTYDFTRICYYPEYACWRSVQKDGSVNVFGGSSAAPGDSNSGNIQWGVRRGNWYGNSALASSEIPQERYPLAFNLVRQENRWGDRVTYTYECVEQAVGSGGLTYTKACYPRQIVDTFGRTLTFAYGDKLYTAYDPANPATASAAREYADPHKPVANDTPNAYQDRYETRYLQRLTVQDSDGGELYQMDFAFETASLAGVPEADPLYGDTVKRFLTAVTQTHPAGDSLPGLVYAYDLDPDGPHPGALTTITYPSGGTATYSYEEHDLPLCARSLRLERPATQPRENWRPRVWFGTDYAVVAWYNTDSTTLQLEIYTWLGFWYRWSGGTSGDALSFKAPLKLDSLAVVPQGDFFLLSYQSSRDDLTEAHLFHKLDNTLGQWIKYNQPLRFPSLQVQFQAGNQFALAVDNGGRTLDRLTWNWAERSWTSQRFNLSSDFCAGSASSERQWYITASGSYYLVLCYDRGADPGNKHNQLSLTYLDALGAWHDGGTTQPNDIVIAQVPNQTTFAWAPGATFAAASFLTRSQDGAYDAALQIFHWDGDWQFLDALEYRHDFNGKAPVPWTASLLDNSLVTAGPQVLRFNGERWQHGDLGQTLPSTSSSSFWYAEGSDLAMVTENGTGQIVSTMLAYDPDRDSEAWQAQAQQLLNLTEPLPFQKTHMFPTAAADYVTLGRDVYFRGSSNSWASLAAGEPDYRVPEGETIDSTTMVNESPSFLAYQRVDDRDSTLKPLGIKVLNLENGRVGEIEEIDQQIFKVYDLSGRPQARSGQGPQGLQAMVTFPLDAESLDRAASITLWRHVDGRIDGTVRAATVSHLVIDTGYEQHRIAYDYDQDSAVCDPTGKVVKYLLAGQYAQEAAGSSERPYGTTESVFLNGLPSDHPVSGSPASLQRRQLAFQGSRRLAVDTTDPETTLDVLDGFLQRQNLYDAAGSLVAWTEKDWQVEFAAQPAGGGEPIPLRGNWVYQSQERKQVDGVTSTQIIEVDLANGERQRETHQFMGSQGQTETHVQETTFAYDPYPELLAVHLLSAPAQVRQQVSVGASASSRDAVPISVSATRYRPWTRPLADGSGSTGDLVVWDTVDSWKWRGGADSHFSAWNVASSPSDAWQLQSTTSQRDDRGQISESVDALGRPASVLRDLEDRWTLASFGSASLSGDEASYLGFEAYERDGGWSLVSATSSGSGSNGSSWQTWVEDERGHTGQRCLRLASTGSQGLERTFTPATQDGHYLFTCWYQTDAGFSPATGAAAGWTVTVRRGSEVLDTVELPFEATEGDWRFVSQGIDLSRWNSGSSGTDLSITLRAANTGSVPARLDDLRFSPLHGSFEAHVYDARWDQETASLGAGPQTTRKAYDDYQRPIAAAGPSENVSGLTTAYLSRQWNDAFEAAIPNSEIKVQGSDAGFYADFLRDGDWQQHFSSATPGQWTVSGGNLAHTGNSEGRLQLASPEILGDWGATVLVRPQSTPSGSVGIAIGDEISLLWDPASKDWTLTDHGSNRAISSRRTPPNRGRRAPLVQQSHRAPLAQQSHRAPLAQQSAAQTSSSSNTSTEPDGLQRQWLLAVRGETVLFWADGEPLFAYLAGRPLSGAPTLIAATPIAFPVFAVSAGAQVSASFRDGASKERQTQQLLAEGDGHSITGPASIISQVIYDPEGRKAVTTKPATLTPSSSAPLLAYRDAFVTGLDWTTGVMSGEVSTYYSASGGGFSDDQGYPYSRERYEDSPLGRKVETGKAGKDFAIDLRIPEADRHTTRLSYGANAGSTGGNTGFMPWLPAGQYRQTVTTDPDGRQRFEVKDAADTTLGQGVLQDPALEGGNGQRYNTTAYETSWDLEGTTKTTHLPNSYAPPSGSTADDWRKVQLTDPLGNAVREQTPDTGVSEMVYDPLGKLRFRQSAEGAGQGWFVYQRYDSQSRPVETGSLDQGWDRAQLQQLADTDPDYPPTPDTWSRVSDYDGDGSEALALGRLTDIAVASTEASTEGETASREHYSYSIAGKTIESRVELVAKGSVYSLSYEYNNLGKVVRTVYPPAAQGGQVPEVRNSYDSVGRLVAVGSGDDAPDAYARYRYNANNLMAQESLASGSAAAVDRAYSYLSPGWLSAITGAGFEQQVRYTPDGGQTGYWSGLVAEESFLLGHDIPGGLPQEAVREYSYRYTYDQLTQLTEAAASSGGQARPEWSLGSSSQQVTYDPNGNFLELPQGNAPLSFAYHAGTDEVKNTDGGTAEAYLYDADGNVVSANGRETTALSWNRVNGRARSASTAAGEVHFGYDGRGKRLQKSTAEGDKLYLRGPDGRTLLSLEHNGTSEPVLTRPIYGPKGLAGVISEDGSFQPVLRDRLGSTRLLLASDGAANGSWSYLPFGGLLDAAGPQAEVFSILYTGQELDRDLGLYNFNARLYDPVLGRFWSVDPKWQFASPYIYAGNDPLLFTDPSGEFSMAALGVILGGAAFAVLGAAAIVLTAGAATPWVALAGATVGGALLAGGMASVNYGISHRNEHWTGKTWGGWAATVGIQAAVGAVSGFTGASMAASSANAVRQAGVAGTSQLLKTAGKIGLVQGVIQGVGGGGGQLVGNLIDDPKKWHDGVLTATVSGFLTGFVSGGLIGGRAVSTGAQLGLQDTMQAVNDDFVERLAITTLQRDVLIDQNQALLAQIQNLEGQMAEQEAIQALMAIGDDIFA